MYVHIFSNTAILDRCIGQQKPNRSVNRGLGSSSDFQVWLNTYPHTGWDKEDKQGNGMLMNLWPFPAPGPRSLPSHRKGRILVYGKWFYWFTKGKPRWKSDVCNVGKHMDIPHFYLQLQNITCWRHCPPSEQPGENWIFAVLGATQSPNMVMVSKRKNRPGLRWVGHSWKTCQTGG